MKVPKLIFIVGATATGKSYLAMEAARKYGGEILNCDSIQVFKSLDVGSAKPSKEDQQKTPHHLVDFVEEGLNYTAGEFHSDALAVLESASQRNVEIIYIVGGSGFYVNALKYGLYKIPKVPQDLHEQVRALDPNVAYVELKILDPDYAQIISANDHYRVYRALEVIRYTGKKFSDFQKEFQKEELPYFSATIGLTCEKQTLRQRVQRRTEKMLDSGWEQEVRQLLDKGLQDWAPLSSVGYKEVVSYIKGELPQKSLVDEIVKNTMKLVKKQRTWFKKDSQTQWFDCELGFDQALEYIQNLKNRKQ